MLFRCYFNVILCYSKLLLQCCAIVASLLFQCYVVHVCMSPNTRWACCGIVHEPNNDPEPPNNAPEPPNNAPWCQCSQCSQWRQCSRWIIIDDGNAMLAYTWNRATTDYSYIYAGNRGLRNTAGHRLISYDIDHVLSDHANEPASRSGTSCCPPADVSRCLMPFCALSTIMPSCLNVFARP